MGEWVAAEGNNSFGNGREKLETPLVECPWDVTAAQVKISAEQPEMLEKYWQCQMAASPSPLPLPASMGGLPILSYGWGLPFSDSVCGS